MLLLLATLNPQPSTFAQGTAFTYQGRLNDNGSAANGLYDFRCQIHDKAGPPGDALVSSTVTNAAVPVTNGLFVLNLDFGSDVFNGQERWLLVTVRTNGGGAFTALAPRQKLTPTPYAVFAENVGSGGLTAGIYGNAVTLNNAANSFSGSFTGNGAGVVNVNAATLGGLSSSSFWKLSGNAGANPTNGNFIGTTDNLPLEFKVNGARALRFEPNTNGAPNIIGGSSVNYASNGVVGATIGGGGTLNYFSQGPSTNSVTANYGTVGGGTGNTAGGYNATVSGGGFNTADGSGATVAGGYSNSANGPQATVSGGEVNVADGGGAAVGGGNNNNAYGQASTVSGGDANTVFHFATTVGGGWQNIAVNQYATVPGGYKNTAWGESSFAAGQRANANHDGAFVWADSQAADFTSTSSNQFLIRAGGGVGINNANPQAPLHVTGGGDASLNSGGNIISGLIGGQNIVIDNNEIISRNNGAASDLILNFGSGNVGIGRIPTANTLEISGNASKTTAGSWLANSDARIKTGVQTVTNALDKLARVRLVQFRYTDDYRAAHRGIADREYLNVVAQEFQKVFPADVKHSGEKLANGDDILQVDTYPLTIYSAAAIQEMNQKVEDWSKKSEVRSERSEIRIQTLIEELKQKATEIADLQQRLEALERIIRNQKSD